MPCDLVERLYTGYHSLILTHDSSYRKRLNAVVDDMEMHEKYFNDYSVCEVKNGCLIFLSDADSDEERSGGASPSSADGGIVEVVSLRLALPSYLLVKFVLFF